MANLTRSSSPADTPDEFDARRLDTEWAVLNAIREMIGMMMRDSSAATYDESLVWARELDPEQFNPKTSVLIQGRENPVVAEYRQRAEAQSELDKREVTPLELVDGEIEQYKRLLSTGRNRKLIRKRLDHFRKVRSLLAPKKFSESQLIIRDVFKSGRNLPSPPIEGDTYREYRISDERGIRIRLLHPDKPEHTTGADLIYEECDDAARMARITAIQYKIWNGTSLYLSQANNLEKQMNKMRSVFCDAGFCDSPAGGTAPQDYRLPYCSAFLKPTDKLQYPNSPLISSGLHVPICVAFRTMVSTAQGKKKIEKEKIKNQSLSHKVFEEIFNSNMLGSRWLPYDDVEKLYRDHRIIEPEETIVIHAQEFSFL